MCPSLWQQWATQGDSSAQEAGGCLSKQLSTLVGGFNDISTLTTGGRGERGEGGGRQRWEGGMSVGVGWGRGV